MEQVSPFIQLLFLATTITCAFLFIKAARYNRFVLLAILFIVVLQSILAWKDFYQQFDALPPRFLFMILPSLLLVLFLFFTKAGKQIANGLDIKQITLLHTVRVPVEICLHVLFMAHLIPQLMTYEGWNFDIISGITAPFVYYFAFVKPVLSKQFLIGWNWFCLALLATIVTLSILSAKTPFQQLAFEQPNTGIAYFPFVLLPSLVVPLVAVSHIAAIRLLRKK